MSEHNNHNPPLSETLTEEDRKVLDGDLTSIEDAIRLHEAIRYTKMILDLLCEEEEKEEDEEA